MTSCACDLMLASVTWRVGPDEGYGRVYSGTGGFLRFLVKILSIFVYGITPSFLGGICAIFGPFLLEV